MDFFDAHLLIDRFAHVVNGQGSDGNGGQRFHFDAGLSGDFRGCCNDDAIAFNSELHFTMSEGQGMAERNEFPGFFGGADSGDAGDGQNVSLGDLISLNGANGRGL